MAYFKVTLYGGSMAVIEARTLASARKRALREEGTNNVASVVRATDEDIDWYEVMRSPLSVREN